MKENTPTQRPVVAHGKSGVKCQALDEDKKRAWFYIERLSQESVNLVTLMARSIT